MEEKGIIGAICHSVQQYAKVHNKYMKNYHKKWIGNGAGDYLQVVLNGLTNLISI